MATIIDSRDLNRYEVIKALSIDSAPLKVVLDSGTAPKSASQDAFGRLRFASPLTLFDSSHRYKDNGLWESSISGGTATFNSNQGCVDLSVSTVSGNKVYRETKRVFAYQPGKSLLVLNTFVFNAAKTNLRQRCGYFSTANGYYVQLNESTLSLVERTSVSGSLVETTVNNADWNADPLDGTGVSGLKLDITKAQILWLDMEWLGVGDVRMGFVIDGKFILCHTFKHSNVVTTPYITTACLPLRYEIENTGTTASSSTLKQICSTVISEGGYELRGTQFSVTTPITASIATGTAGTYTPIISLRLSASPNYLDAIAILSSLSLLGTGNNVNYSWQIRKGGTTSGGTWANPTGSSLEYNLTGTSYSGGTVVDSGFISSTTQASTAINNLDGTLFKFQLERNSFTSTPYELTLVVAADTALGAVFAGMSWEEILR